MKKVALVAAVLIALAGCGGKSDSTADPSSDPTTSSAAPTSSGPAVAVSYGSLVRLRDAAIAAGYVCENWVQDNKVTLAAESGSCSGSSVISTYASDGDLQKQLDQDKQNTALLTENGIASTPELVGPNWIFVDPKAASLQPSLGGIVIGGKAAS